MLFPPLQDKAFSGPPHVVPFLYPLTLPLSHFYTVSGNGPFPPSHSPLFLPASVIFIQPFLAVLFNPVKHLGMQFLWKQLLLSGYLWHTYTDRISSTHSRKKVNAKALGRTKQRKSIVISTTQGRNSTAQQTWWLTWEKPSTSENRKPFEIVEGINAKDLGWYNYHPSTWKGEAINLFFSAHQMFQNMPSIQLSSILDFE